MDTVLSDFESSDFGEMVRNNHILTHFYVCDKITEYKYTIINIEIFNMNMFVF